MTIIQLPPQEPPATLTAYARANNLREHLAAFLAANNLSGFINELPPETDRQTVAGMLQLIAAGEVHSRDQLKRDAGRLKRVVPGLKHGHALEIIAAILGYRAWSVIAARGQELVPNRNRESAAMARLFSPATATLREAKREVLTIKQRKPWRCTGTAP